MDMESPLLQHRENVQVGPDLGMSTPPRYITSLGPIPITNQHSKTPQGVALTQSSDVRNDRGYIRSRFSHSMLLPGTISYPPPPPYSDIASSSRRGKTPPDEKEKWKRRSLSQESRSREDKGRDHRRRKNVDGEDLHSHLRVIQIHPSTAVNIYDLKYISRERKGREKTIVQEIKTVTKKYKRTEAKRNESRTTSGLQEISSDESTEEEKVAWKKSHKSDKNLEKKCDGHRWSSSSSESEERKKTRRADKKDHMKRDTIRHLPGFEIGTPTRSYLGTSEFAHTQSAGLATPTNFPPPTCPVATPSIGYTTFNPHLPPPAMNPSMQCSNFSHGISKSPAVALRFVEASPPRAHQSLEDRVASLFGKKTESKIFGNQENLRTMPHIFMYCSLYCFRDICPSRGSCCDETEDMDVEVDSDISPENEEQRKERLEKEREFEQLRMNSLSLEVCAQVLAELRRELGEVLVKDLHKKIEIAAFEAMEGAWLRRRTEIEEKKRNQKIRPPSPKCLESSRSDSASDASGDDSDAAHKSTTASQATDSSDELVLIKRRKEPRTRSPDSRSSIIVISNKRNITYMLNIVTTVMKNVVSVENVVHRVTANLRVKSALTSEILTATLLFTAVEKDETTPSKTSTSISLSTTDSEESEVQEDSIVVTDQTTFSDLPCSTVAMKPPDVISSIYFLFYVVVSTLLFLYHFFQTTDELLEWHESIPRSSYHIHYTEHCYASTLLIPQPVVKRPPAKKISPKSKPAAIRKGKRIDAELTDFLPSSINVREKLPDVKPTTFFPKRSPYDQRNILYGWESGFDIEDQNYLREVWARLQPVGGPLPPWRRCIPFNSVSWEVTPKLLDRPSRIGRLDIYYDDPELEGIAPHDKGCARAQGYYKLSVKEKRRLIRRPEEGHQDKTDISERDETAVRHHVQANKESRSMHRRLLTTMGDTNTDFFKVNQLKYRKKMIKFARSRIHGWGLYALEPIAPDDMIVEYVGQKVRPTVADEREKAYERRGIGSSYLFRIDDTCEKFQVIDATKMGNFARFINHSCQPNCYAKVVTVDGDRRIVIYSKTLINKGDEITYDYKFPIEDDKIDCLCGAPNCRGTLN
uniref:[histone H3]-lysine(4) N-trimethyltransferase n=1 Tax=Heterorhabditis bacteriophora TaxID=37862 RepID=A0A1I7X9G2_HETBA